MEIKNMVKVEDGHEIQVGDVVVSSDRFYGTTKKPVTRVTKKYAFVKYSDGAEGKFHRVYNSFGFESLPRHKWNTIDYTVYTKKS
jgi:hypothetical protein